MTGIRRIYVEKKRGFNIEAEHLFYDLKNNLNIKNISNLRIINCYDIEGLDDCDYGLCKATILSEPPVDNVYEEVLDFDADDFVFSVKYLPGQYDQRADSAMQCIQIVTKKEKTIVEASKVYVLKGMLSGDEKAAIKKYCINPVDSMECRMEKPKSLIMDMNVPDDIKTFNGFVDKTDDEIINMRNELGLAMSGDDLIFCRNYFKDVEKRNPSVTEIRVIDTYWSDHCRHTTFLTNIENVEIGAGRYNALIKDAYEQYLNIREYVYADRISEKPVCLMDIAVIGMKALKKKGYLNDLDESEEINACSIVVNVDVDGKDEEWLVMFKNETHNHPTEIEPFGGAATCLGGAIRDPLSGRSFVYQAMRVTGSGNPLTKVEDTLPGKLPQRKITQGAAAGYSSYGNQIGLATGIVNEIYDEGYVAKRLEIGAVIGAAKKENVVRERPQKGDIIILTGGRTGRDGCGGATGSSKEHTEESILTCGAEVQKGNSPTERKLQRLFRNPEVSKMIKRCNDFGAGGVSVAIGELAEGLDINLDAIPKKYDGLDGTELAISESQERMAVVVSSDNADRFIKLASEENLEAVIVANVMDNRRLRMFWRGNDIVNISRDFLDTNGAKQTSDAFIKTDFVLENNKKQCADIKTAWIENLSDLNVACQKGLSERFDSTVGAGTVFMPFGGKYQLTPIEAMAAKIPVLSGETNTVSLMSYGYNPTISKKSPFHGAVLAVVESICKIVAVGGKYENIRMTFQEYFERLGSDPTRWGKPLSSLLGALYAQLKLNIPSIGGKDSMSGTFKDLDVPPTLVSFAVNTAKQSDIISNEFKKSGSILTLIETEYDDNCLPDFEKLVNNFSMINNLIKGGQAISVHTVGFGGIAGAISKMSFGNAIGAELSYEDEADLFAEKYGTFVLEMDCSEDEVYKVLKDVRFKIIGRTTEGSDFIVNGKTISGKECLEAWISRFESVFPTELLENYEKSDINFKPFVSDVKKASSIKIAKPRVLIPVFPGTNGEYDAAIQFEKAGAVVDMFVIKNLTVAMLEECIGEMVKCINNSQIIMFPGGFSAGDEPEGSGKFIAAVFRNPFIKDAVMNMLNNRDGLMLGICNGFQALIKLGLVPYGEIRDMDVNSPTLTFNKIGRHISNLARTKVVSKLSPWFNSIDIGDIHTIPVSHGEGRFVADEAYIKQLAQNGQIATQYVDLEGNPTYDIMFNSNGSMCAIEGITSPDGRILGKMGHSERIGDGLLKNVDGNKEQYLFGSGVSYFQ